MHTNKEDKKLNYMIAIAFLLYAKLLKILKEN